MSRVYAARRPCGHIIAAFPLSIDKNAKAEILKQFTKAGYDMEIVSEIEVSAMFAINCDCGKPPLLSLMENPSTQGEPEDDGGADQADIDAMSADAEADVEPEDYPDDEDDPEVYEEIDDTEDDADIDSPEALEEAAAEEQNWY